jgi:hypothetical protein
MTCSNCFVTLLVRVRHSYLQFKCLFSATDNAILKQGKAGGKCLPVRNAYFFRLVVASAKRKPILPGHFSARNAY